VDAYGRVPLVNSLPKKIHDSLNRGEVVAAELATTLQGHRCFLSIVPVPKLGVPREPVRYINSRYSIWEYWSFLFRWIELRPGWELAPLDFDLFLASSEEVRTHTSDDFFDALARWLHDPDLLRHHLDCDCPE
jgi:hypothetical protein